MLVKDLNCSDAILRIFDEIITSRKIKKLLYINKSSKQFHKASTFKPNKTSEKGTGDGNILAYEGKSVNTTNLMFVEKQKEIINLTSFDQSYLKNIGKFYNLFGEMEYIKEEIMKIMKQVI